MLGIAEKRILEYLSGKLLVTKTELKNHLAKNCIDGAEIGLGRLNDLGLVEKVESLGTCFVITQKGMRTIKEGKI